MKHKTTVIFDLDGTLLYTLEDLQASVNYALSQMGYHTRSLEDVRQFVGHGVHRLIECAVPEDTSKEHIEETFAIFCKHYSENCNNATRPYDGIMEVLEQLQQLGYKLAIVSNKMDSAVKDLNEIYFKHIIPVAIGATETVRKKPAPDTVLAALNELGATKEEAVYVGDSEVDIQTAQNTGIPCISCSWGFRHLDELEAAHASLIISSPSDLLTVLEAKKLETL